MHCTVYMPLCMHILNACVCTFYVFDCANIYCVYMYVVCICMHVCICILHMCSVVQPVFIYVLHEHAICYMGEMCTVYMSCVCMCRVPNSGTTHVLCMCYMCTCAVCVWICMCILCTVASWANHLFESVDLSNDKIESEGHRAVLWFLGMAMPKVGDLGS